MDLSGVTKRYKIESYPQEGYGLVRSTRQVDHMMTLDMVAVAKGQMCDTDQQCSRETRWD